MAQSLEHHGAPLRLRKGASAGDQLARFGFAPVEQQDRGEACQRTHLADHVVGRLEQLDRLARQSLGLDDLAAVRENLRALEAPERLRVDVVVGGELLVSKDSLSASSILPCEPTASASSPATDESRYRSPSPEKAS